MSTDANTSDRTEQPPEDTITQLARNDREILEELADDGFTPAQAVLEIAAERGVIDGA